MNCETQTGEMAASTKALTAIVLALSTTLGGYGAFQAHDLANNPESRPDAWTAQDAAEQERRHDEKLHRLESRLTAEIKAVDVRLDALEQCRVGIETKLDALLGIIARMNDEVSDIRRENGYGRSN